MKIAQLSDIHIDDEGQMPNGVNVRENFLACLESISSYHPDRIVITGDLCCKVGKVEIYEWILLRLKDFKIPIRVISGNHDHAKDLYTTFQVLQPYEDFNFYETVSSDGCFIYMDTALGMVEGGPKRWLENLLRKGQFKWVHLFIHYPILQMNVPHMENKYFLKDRHLLSETLQNSAAEEVHVWSGHYHRIQNKKVGKVHQHICGSTYFGIDNRFEDFEPDRGFVPSWNMIELDTKTGSVFYEPVFVDC